MSNAPAANRREKISLGNEHKQVNGSLVSQSLSAKGESNVRSYVKQATSNTTAVSVGGKDCLIEMFGIPVQGNIFTVNNDAIKVDSYLVLMINDLGGASAVVLSSVQAVGAVTITLATVTAAGADPAKIRLLVL